MKNKLRLICGKVITSPKGLHTRPTTSKVREAVMNILQGKLKNSHWLDLCSGSGIMACEAIEKGAQRVLCIESNKESAQICKSNLISISSGLTSKTHTQVVCSDVLKILKKRCSDESFNFNKDFPYNDNRFDLVYIDPPYNSGIYSSILDNLIIGNWLKKESIVICEFSKTLIPDISSKWLKINKKLYGNTGLFFLTPNQAFHFHVDTDSMRPQKVQE